MKFFRKIRQTALAKNKISQYIRYALGEIILLVIGILIALQINTWNENRKTTNKRDDLVSNLIEEFKENSEQLNSISKENKKTIENMDLFFKHAYAPTINISVDSLKSLALYFAMGHNYQPELGFFKEAKANGNLNLIKNKNLLKAFTKFETHYELYRTLNKLDIKEYFQGSFWEYRKYTGSITSLVHYDFGNYKNPFKKELDNKAYFELVNSNFTTAFLENRYNIFYAEDYHLNKMAGYSDEIVEILIDFKE